MATTRTASALGIALCGLAGATPWDALLTPVEAQSGAAIQIDVAADRHPIDPRIYGVSWGSPAELQALNAPVNRWGGNSTTRYNWQSNADNRGSDWYFESIAYADATPGERADSFISESLAGGAEPMMTIPIIGWMAKVGPGRSKLAGFSNAKYPGQTDCDWQWFPDACSGEYADGSLVTGNDPNDANMPSTPAIQKAWAEHLVSRWGGAANGGLRYYLYDNEPTLWHSTHRDVQPTGVRMAELRDATIAYGTAIRAADPNAILVGPEVWGWMAYFWSGFDQQYMANTGCYSCWPDRETNGGMAFMPWLLDQLHQHELGGGTRLLDVFTVHYYPQGGEFGSDTTTAMQQRRNRSTRSLWDPSYVDETWINDTVRLIPRLREWVATYYPGTEIGITEYNWGAESHINGATTQADILGIFGRQGLDVGTRWTVPPSDSPTFKAFQMYRNYDGSLSTYGDVSVRATVPNPDNLSAFAAERSSDGALTVVVINKVTSSAPVTLSLSGFTPGPSAQVWQLGPSNAITRGGDVAVSSGTIATTLPAQTITLFVVPRSTATVPTLSIGNVTIGEGASGTQTPGFAVALSAVSSQVVTVDYATANGTAAAGSDYGSASGTLTFTPGQTTKTISVPVVGDLVIEPDETFTVVLSGATNATIAQPTGTGTIVNDDWPALSIDDVVVAEGNTGTTDATFTVSLSGAAPFAVSVEYVTANGTAIAGSDYVSQTGNLTFAAGQVGRTVTVLVNGDATVEPTETFVVDLSKPSGATLTDGQGQATISNDDSAPTTEGVMWTRLLGATASSNSLTKSAGGAVGWNAGASSTRAIGFGDGYAEFMVTAKPVYFMAGLSHGDTDTSYQDVDYEVYICGNGHAYALEGTTQKWLGTYEAGDVFRVEMRAGDVRYLRNGVVAYEHAVTPTYPLLLDTSLYTPGATLGNAMLSGSLVDAVPSEPVAWTNSINATSTGNALTKSSTAGVGWNAGASSTRGLAGNGYAEFAVGAKPVYFMAGLSHGDADTTYQDIDFEIYICGNGHAYALEGASQTWLGTYEVSDVFRIEIRDGSIRYIRNGVVKYEHAVTPTYPLLLDTSLYTPGVQVTSAVLSGTIVDASASEAVEWTTQVNTTSSGGTLTKDVGAPLGWNAGAVSTKAIASGEGYAEFTVSASNVYWMAGLSSGNTDTSYQDIDYKVYICGNGHAYALEGATQKWLGTYTAGDVFRIEIQGGSLRYRKNGVTMYEHAVIPAYPLLLDTSLYTPGVQITSAVLAGTLE